MYGWGETERGDSLLLHQKMSTTRVGMRWERILRTHRHELNSLMAVHPDLQRHAATALHRVAAAGSAGRCLDTATVSAVLKVLDDVQRLGGFELQHAAAALRDELMLARGRSLDDALH